MTRRMAFLCVSWCAITAVLVAQTPAQPAKPNPELKKLAVYLGNWTYAGDAKQSPFGPAGKITGTETVTLMPGGFFIEDRWEETDPPPLGTVKGLQVWSYDPIKKSLAYTYFTSAGESGSGTVTVNGNTWSSAGSGVTYEGKPAHGRGTWTFGGANGFSIASDASTDGKTCARSFEGKWTKAK